MSLAHLNPQCQYFYTVITGAVFGAFPGSGGIIIWRRLCWGEYGTGERDEVGDGFIRGDQ